MLTSKQADILSRLMTGPKTVSVLTADLIDLFGNYWTKDSVHSSLRRMEDRELVRRVDDYPTKWELTSHGRNEFHNHGG